MSLLRRSARIALLLLLPVTALAGPTAPPRVPGGVRMAGAPVSPREVVFSELPPRTGGEYVGPVSEGHPEGVWEDAERVFERLKRSPKRLDFADLGSKLTLDPTVADAGKDGFSALAPAAGTAFEGITQGPYIPSEPTVAAGPLNVFTAGNVTVTVTNKDGSNRVETDGAAFFGVPGSEGAISDAQCFYDARRGRFLALAFTQGTSSSGFSNFYLAISKTSDARGAWWLYKYDMTKDGSTVTANWSDYESLGLTDDKLVMTGQQFTFAGNAYQYPKVRVLDRDALYAGTPSGYVDFVNFSAPPGGDGNDNFVTKCARNLSADATAHLLCVRTNGGSRVTYREVTGPPSAPTLSNGDLVSVAAYSVPPDAVQKNSARLVATNDCRPTDFYWRNGVLVVAWHTAATISSTSVSAIRLLRLRTSDRTALTDETFGAASTFYYFPAVTVDSAGTVYLGFDRSSSTEFPSAYATGKRRSDSAIEPSVLLKAGLSATSQSRWGDYTGIDNDASASGPSGTAAWYAGQWTKASNTFGTWIQRLAFPYGQIAGSVVDDCDASAATTGDRVPLAGVTITLMQGAMTAATAVTDSAGTFAFGYLDAGTYDIVVAPPDNGVAVDATAGSGATSETRLDASDVRVALTTAQSSAGNAFVVAAASPAPLAAALSPAARTVGDSAFTLSVHGTGFGPCSVVRLDDSPRPTTFAADTLLTAAIPAGDLLAVGVRAITVVTPLPGGGASNALSLMVNAPPDTLPPVVTVTFPAGAESLAVGSTQAITWTATDDRGVVAVDLAWSSDGGATFAHAIAMGVPNDGTYPWTVPAVLTATARVRVTAYDAAGHAAADSSHADFAIAGWTITATAGEHGTIAPLGAVIVADGATPAFTITSDAGYHVAAVLVDGAPAGAVTEYTFAPVHADGTIDAAFVDTTGYVLSLPPRDGPPTAFALEPVRPNPAPGSGHTVFALPRTARVHVGVLDVQGREVMVLAEGEYGPGLHDVAFRDGGRLGAGLYFVRLRVGGGPTLARRFAVTR